MPKVLKVQVNFNFPRFVHGGRPDLAYGRNEPLSRVWEAKIGGTEVLNDHMVMIHLFDGRNILLNLANVLYMEEWEDETP